jgi:hypothetical protein
MEVKMKKLFRVEVKVDKCEDIFREGLGPGVLGFIDIAFDLPKEDYKSPSFASFMKEQGDELINKLIVCDIKEVERDR